MVRWIEVTLYTNGEAAEAIAQELQPICHQGIVIEQPELPPDTYDEGDVPSSDDVIVRGYFPDDDRAADRKQQISQTLRYMNMMLPMPEPIYATVEDEDWAHAWKKHYHPVRLGQRMLITPRWLNPETQADDLVIRLDPGMAFGTGTHPTTQLCLLALEGLVKPGMTALDLGCGSGILSIAAAHLGANPIYAIDIDQLAVEATIENARENGVLEAIQPMRGGIETAVNSHAEKPVDLLIVNILAKIIIEMCEQGLGSLVRPGGRAIFSGIIESQLADVETALRSAGLNPVGQQQQGDWVLIEATRMEEFVARITSD